MDGLTICRICTDEPCSCRRFSQEPFVKILTGGKNEVQDYVDPEPDRPAARPAGSDC